MRDDALHRRGDADRRRILAGRLSEPQRAALGRRSRADRGERPAGLHERETFDLPQCPQIRFARIEGPLFFASVRHFERDFPRREEKDGFKTCILNLGGIGKIDLAGADFVLYASRRAREHGNDLHLIAANPRAEDVLERLHCVEVLGPKNIHPHKTGAIRPAAARASDRFCKGLRYQMRQRTQRQTRRLMAFIVSRHPPD